MRLGILPTPWHDTFRSSIPPARPDAAPFLIIIYRPFFPPRYSRMKIVVCMLYFGCRCYSIGRITLWAGSVTRANQPSSKKNCCYAPPIPIERKSCLVIPRLQHVRSLTPRAAAAVSRTRPTPHLHRYLPSVGRTFNIAFGLMCLSEPGVFEPAAYD
ncbi:hypothetical protein L2E82_53723 [Cichorium intybus]|nr:hypothetical protein L2E82_53723 [Cichorium intybus]